jgi:hypothetical protein
MLKVLIKAFTSTPGTWKFDQQSIRGKVKKNLTIFCEIQRYVIFAINCKESYYLDRVLITISH